MNTIIICKRQDLCRKGQRFVTAHICNGSITEAIDMVCKQTANNIAEINAIDCHHLEDHRGKPMQEE